MPFHILNADLIDCFGGSAELLRIFNRLGVCVSRDTLLRHVQTTVLEQGLLQGLNPSGITILTKDNIGFLHSYAQVFSGNQKGLSWHGTTVQAVQIKPSLDPVPLYPTTTSRKRSHALLSPLSSPDVHESVSKQRARTGKEFHTDATSTTLTSYDFHSESLLSQPVESIAMSNFRLSFSEKASVDSFLAKAFTYCLIKNGLPPECKKEFLCLQEFFNISTNAPTPEVGYV